MPKQPRFPIVAVAVDIRKLSHKIETEAVTITAFDCITKDEGDDNDKTVLVRVKYKAKVKGEV